jgi:hypothetical protein
VDTPASRSHAGRQSANQNGSPRPLALCSSVTLATMFRFLVLHVFERKAACLPPRFMHILAAVGAQPARKGTKSLVKQETCFRYRAVSHWHYQCQNKCASSRRLLERRSCGLRLAVQWAQERYLCITGAVASDLEATDIAPHESNSIPYLGRGWPPACASDAVQR